MKKWLFLIASLCLTLAVFPAVAGEVEADPKSEEALVEQAPVEPAAEEVAPALQEEASLDFLPGTSVLFSEPQPLASCTMFQCRQECRSGCPPGCFCFGSCVNDYCECDVICN